jgi:hypothetical protein
VYVFLSGEKPVKYTDPDGRSDFDGSGKKYLKNEPNVKSFLETVRKSPGDYTITAFDRRAMNNKGEKTDLMKHSFYVIANNTDGSYNTLRTYPGIRPGWTGMLLCHCVPSLCR